MPTIRHPATTLAATALLAASACSLGPNAVAQSTADARQAIALDAGERAFVLQEMRGFLESVAGIVSALANDRIADAEAAAKKSGMAVMHSVPPTLRQKLPMEFRKMGHATHAGFDTIAEEASTLGDKAAVLKHLELILNTCTTCHASYRLGSG